MNKPIQFLEAELFHHGVESQRIIADTGGCRHYEIAVHIPPNLEPDDIFNLIKYRFPEAKKIAWSAKWEPDVNYNMLVRLKSYDLKKFHSNEN